MTDPQAFIPYALAADELMVKTTKDQLADVARLLALNIGYTRLAVRRHASGGASGADQS